MDPFVMSILASAGSSIFGSIFGQRAADENRAKDY